jgi:phosphomethylpyrimidine synthase
LTQIEAARAGKLTPEMITVAESERVDANVVLKGVAEGRIAIPRNVNRDLPSPRGIGQGLKIKVNANIGTSADFPDAAPEIEKLEAAVEAGADAIMDLSTGGDILGIRREILKRSPVMIGTVPIYEAVVSAVEGGGSVVDMSADELFDVIERQAKEGVDFITVHCGATLETIGRLRKQGRLTDVVSRGGAFLTCWMIANEKENPLYTRYDDLLDIARRHDVTLSLGDALRPGSINDATDRAQIQELIILGELVQRAREAGVQSMVEGPGHVPMDQIAANMTIEKQLCDGAPFYVLGPLVTDIAPGYDHITAAIGGAIAAMSGADFLCYVTPAEHLGLPTVQDVREGVIASRIAGHAADIVRGIPGAREWDRGMSAARKALDWNKQLELCIDPIKARQLRETRPTHGEETCSMCGSFCAMKVVQEYLGAPAGSES